MWVATTWTCFVFLQCKKHWPRRSSQTGVSDPGEHLLLHWGYKVLSTFVDTTQMAKQINSHALRFLFFLFYLIRCLCQKSPISPKQTLLSPHFLVPDKGALFVLSSLGMGWTVCSPCRTAFDLNTHCGLVLCCMSRCWSTPVQALGWLESDQSQLNLSDLICS